MATDASKMHAVPARPTAPAQSRRTGAQRTHPPRPTRRVLIVDKRNMLLLWLEEKVARRELTVAQADARLHDQGSFAKNWVSPFKDAAGSGSLMVKMARDFGSWKGAQVAFSRNAKGHEIVTFKGWPNGRKIVRGTRYRVDNPRMIELQVGRPGLRAGARESARFGIYLVMAVDVLDYLLRDKATLGGLLGSLSYDIPGVLLATAAGTAAASVISGTAVGMALVGSFAMGPLAVGFLVGLGVGIALTMLDDEYHITDKLSAAYDRALAKLDQVWDALSDEAEARYRQLADSHLVHDLERHCEWLLNRIARQADHVGGQLTQFW